MKIPYPIAPQNAGYPPLITQYFGANPAYYAKFLDKFGKPEKGHMGIDFQAAHGTPVYAVADGLAFYVGPDPHGGDGIYLRFKDDAGNYWTAIYWHLCAENDPTYPPQVGRIANTVKEGDLLGFADNSGAPWESTGDHLHFGLVPCDANGEFLYPANGYGGCVDPKPHFDGVRTAAPTPKPPAPDHNPVDGLIASQRLEAYAHQAQAKGDTTSARIYNAVIALVKAFTGQNTA